MVGLGVKSISLLLVFLTALASCDGTELDKEPLMEEIIENADAEELAPSSNHLSGNDGIPQPEERVAVEKAERTYEAEVSREPDLDLCFGSDSCSSSIQGATESIQSQSKQFSRAVSDDSSNLGVGSDRMETEENDSPISSALSGAMLGSDPRSQLGEDDEAGGKRNAQHVDSSSPLAFAEQDDADADKAEGNLPDVDADDKAEWPPVEQRETRTYMASGERTEGDDDKDSSSERTESGDDKDSSSERTEGDDDKESSSSSATELPSQIPSRYEPALQNPVSQAETQVPLSAELTTEDTQPETAHDISPEDIADGGALKISENSEGRSSMVHLTLSDGIDDGSRKNFNGDARDDFDDIEEMDEKDGIDRIAKEMQEAMNIPMEEILKKPNQCKMLLQEECLKHSQCKWLASMKKCRGALEQDLESSRRISSSVVVVFLFILVAVAVLVVVRRMHQLVGRPIRRMNRVMESDSFLINMDVATKSASFDKILSNKQL